MQALETLTKHGAFQTGMYQVHPRFYIKTTEHLIQADVVDDEEQATVYLDKLRQLEVERMKRRRKETGRDQSDDVSEQESDS